MGMRVYILFSQTRVSVPIVVYLYVKSISDIKMFRGSSQRWVRKILLLFQKGTLILQIA